MFLADDVICVGGKYMFAARDINAICSFDENEKQINVLRTDDSGDIWAYRRYGRIFRYNNRLFFLPLWAPNILVYDINKENFETIKIELKEGYSTDYFFAGKIIDEKLVMIGCQYPVIAILDLINMNLNYYEEPFIELLPKHKVGGDCFFRCDIANIGKKVYVASCLSNQVLEFDVLDGSFRWYEVGNKNNTYSGIAYDGKKFWLSPRKGKRAVCWNEGENSIQEFDLPFENNDEEKCTCLGVVYDGKRIVFPGMNIDKTIIVDPEDVDYVKNMQEVDKGFIFYNNREGLNYALKKDGELEIYATDDYQRPIKTVRTINDKTLIAKFIHETGEMIHEGYKELELTDYIGMVTS